MASICCCPPPPPPPPPPPHTHYWTCRRSGGVAAKLAAPPMTNRAVVHPDVRLAGRQRRLDVRVGRACRFGTRSVCCSLLRRVCGPMGGGWGSRMAVPPPASRAVGRLRVPAVEQPGGAGLARVDHEGVRVLLTGLRVVAVQQAFQPRLLPALALRRRALRSFPLAMRPVLGCGTVHRRFSRMAGAAAAAAVGGGGRRRAGGGGGGGGSHWSGATSGYRWWRWPSARTPGCT